MDEPTFELKNRGLQIEASGIPTQSGALKGILLESPHWETILLPLNCYNKTPDNVDIDHARL
jgi:hypothetical protein